MVGILTQLFIRVQRLEDVDLNLKGRTFLKHIQTSALPRHAFTPLIVLE